MQEAEEERRQAALKVELAKEKTRQMKVPVGLAKPLTVCLYFRLFTREKDVVELSPTFRSLAYRKKHLFSSETFKCLKTEGHCLKRSFFKKFQKVP